MTSERNLGHVLPWRMPSLEWVNRSFKRHSHQIVKAMQCSAVKAYGWHGKGKNNWTVKCTNALQGLVCGKGTEKGTGHYSALCFHDSFSTSDQREIQLWEGGSEECLVREVFASLSITFLICLACLTLPEAETV